MSYKSLKENMKNIYGKPGLKWIEDLPQITQTIAKSWHLQNLSPIDNMSFHFVAKATNSSNEPVVLKIGFDKKSMENEINALQYFNGQGAVKLLNHDEAGNAILLQQANPGVSLKTIYPNQSDYVIEQYVKTMQKLHNQSDKQHLDLPSIQDWLASIDQAKSEKLPKDMLFRALDLKTELLLSMKKTVLLHGDLHQDNVLKNDADWLVIDPKGVYGEPEFEAAWFDYVHENELQNEDIKKIFHQRIETLAQKANFNPERLKNWVFVRLILSAVWSIEDNSDPELALRLAELV